MDENHSERKYEAFKIPAREQFQKKRLPGELSKSQDDEQLSLFDGPFYEMEYEQKQTYEIDYGSSPFKGVGKYVMKPQKIEPPAKDEIRELFQKMREIERQYRSPLANYSKFYDQRAKQDKSRIFYKQAEFMKDFSDDYSEEVPFSSYFPYYQMLGYEQLRTYFTWRTQVRNGVIKPTSLSYVYLYLYELLNNIGVEDPQDGLEKLMTFWTSYQDYDTSIDKYVIKWIKDYHIYYNLPQSLTEFVREHHLTNYYPNLTDTKDSFDLLSVISKYDIKKSAFFTDENSTLLMDCFGFVIDNVREVLAKSNISLDDIIFYPVKKMIPWCPFKDALFFHCYKQPDKRVVLSDKEIYVCSKNNWTFGTTITSESGRQLIGYIMKQMESVLRQLTRFKFKLSANITMINSELLNRLKTAGVELNQLVETTVKEFYREATKTVVTVDSNALARIREEALMTQESLIVDEPSLSYEMLTPNPPTEPPRSGEVPKYDLSTESSVFGELSEPDSSTEVLLSYEMPELLDFSDVLPAPSHYRSTVEAAAPSEPLSSWELLKDALSDVELQAIGVLIRNEDIKKFADSNHIMLEVLIDGINEKAMDSIGDNILDEELTVYIDYEEQVKGMVN